MKFINPIFAYPCFSGDCQLCSSCCKSESLSKDSESIQRAKTLSKFMNYQKINDETNYYIKKINEFVKNTHYFDPNEIGFTKKYMNHSNMKYKLVQNKHDLICDDPLCQIIYLSSDDHKKNNIYPKYPIYSRIDNENKYNNTPHNLCAVCIQR